MHENEIPIDEHIVRNLIDSQFPEWAHLKLSPIQSSATDHAIYRLGDTLSVRLPRLLDNAAQLEKEHRWLPLLAPHLPLAIPTPIAMGKPDAQYPCAWSVFNWIAGQSAYATPISNHTQAATDLGNFIKALHTIDTTGGPSTFRGEPLATRDQEVHKALKALKDLVDTKSALKIWEGCLAAPTWDKPPVWLHSDLLPANILVQQGKISGIIDFGMMGVGDPACDLLPAWSLFDKVSRSEFKNQLQVDDATWQRGKGWALSIGLIIIPYYLKTNPGLLAVGKRLVKEVLEDLGN